MLNEEQIGKLSKNAQNYIHKLRGDVEYYKNQANKIEAGDTRVTIGMYDDEHNLPDNLPIKFYFEGKLFKDAWITVRIEDESLYITSSYPSLWIEPTASNAIRLHLE